MATSDHPQELDWDRSLQVPMCGGHAYKVESALHYLFAAHSREMPIGDGYTEWFDIAVWSDVLAFLVEQRERLRIGEAEPVTFPLTRTRPVLAEIEARRQAKADEKAAKRHAREQRQAERHAKNAEWNSSQVERLENFLLRVEDIGRLHGILVYDELSSRQRMASMYVSLPVNVAGCLGHDFPLFEERGPARCISVFPSYQACHNGRHFLAEVSVHIDYIMLQPQDDLAESIPGAARVQELLLPFVARRGEGRPARASTDALASVDECKPQCLRLNAKGRPVDPAFQEKRPPDCVCARRTQVEQGVSLPRHLKPVKAVSGRIQAIGHHLATGSY